MGEATSLDAFRDALRLMSVPMWNANYADDQGHIMLVFDGLVPKRNGHDYNYWSRVVPGDTSQTMWTDYLSFDELPKSLDPAVGWNQNTNQPPWDMTLPLLDRTKYAPYVAPDGNALPQMRTLRSRRMITETGKISYEDLIAKKHSTRMELAIASARSAPGSERRHGGGPCPRNGITSRMPTAGEPCCFSYSSIATSAGRAGWRRSCA